jgi:hypothetical protein
MDRHFAGETAPKARASLLCAPPALLLQFPGALAPGAIGDPRPCHTTLEDRGRMRERITPPLAEAG